MYQFKEVEEEIVNNVQDSNQYYDFQAIDFLVGQKVDGISGLGYCGVGDDLEGTIEKFKESDNKRLLISRHVALDGGDKNDHFVGMYIEKEQDGYRVSYVDPTGRDTMPGSIKDVMLANLGVKSSDIVRTTNVFQASDEIGAVTNVHCGAFVTDILINLASEDFQIEGDRLNIANQGVDGSVAIMEDLSPEESNAYGSILRTRHLQLMGRDVDDNLNGEEEEKNGDLDDNYLEIGGISQEELKESVDLGAKSQEMDDMTPEVEAQIRSGFEQAIGEMTHAQFCDAMEVMLAVTSDTETPAVISDQVELWEGNDKKGLLAAVTPLAVDISTTTNAFYQHFKDKHGIDAPWMNSKGAFAKNMQDHSVKNPGVCRHEMQLFCEYIKVLDTKPKETQEHFLESFPPKTGAQIACLGGTGNRIGTLVNILNSSEDDIFLLRSHKKLVESQFVDKFRAVPNDGKVHIPSFLSHSLGVESPEGLAKRDPCFSYPSFSMPVFKIWESLRSYAPLMKEDLIKDENVLLRVKEKTKEIVEDLKLLNLDLALTDYETGEGEEIRNVVLDKTGAESIGDVVEENDEGNFQWDNQKITALVTKQLWPKTKEKEGEENSSALQPLIEEISPRSSVFKEETPGILAQLIKSEDRRDVQVGVESLWLLGLNIAGNSPLQFVRVINALEVDNPVKYLKEEIKPKLSHNYQCKVDSILEKNKVHSNNKVIRNHIDNPQELQSSSVLIKIGATDQEVSDAIEKNNNSCFDTMLNRSSFIDQQIVHRPDAVEILRSSIEKGAKLSSLMKKNLLMGAVTNNEVDLVTFLLEEVPLERSAFNDGVILSKVLALNNKPMSQLVIEKGKGNLDFKSSFAVVIDGRAYRGLAPIHQAVLSGDEDLVRCIKEHGGDMDLRTGRNMFYPKSCRPVDPMMDPVLGLVGYLFSQTPAHLAASQGRSSMLKTLSACGSNLDLPAYGKNRSVRIRPIHCAVASGYPGAVQTLIDEGVSIKKESIFEPSLADVSVRYNQPDCLDKLVENGLEIKPNELDRLSLSACVRNCAGADNLKIIQGLVRQGAFLPDFMDYDLARIHQGEEIKSLVRTAKAFEEVASVIIKNVSDSIEAKTLNSKKELTKLKREIYTSLVNIYDLKEYEMITDFEIGRDYNSRFEYVIDKEELAENDNIRKISNVVKESLTARASCKGDAKSIPQDEKKTLGSDVEMTQENLASLLESLKDRESIEKTLRKTSPMPQPVPKTSTSIFSCVQAKGAQKGGVNH